MELVLDIGLQALSIFVLLLGIFGLLVSFALLISPRMVRSLNDMFNKYVSVDKRLTYLNKPIQTDSFTYQHNVLAGISLLAGAAFVLVFLFFRLDIEKILNLFSDHPYVLLYEIVFKSAVMFGKIAGCTAVVIGLFLLILPDIMIRIEDRMDAWIATQSVVDKLDEFHLGVDTLILRFPFLFGFTGLMTSAVLIILSAASLIGK